jgi:hypothetical protein
MSALHCRGVGAPVSAVVASLHANPTGSRPQPLAPVTHWLCPSLQIRATLGPLGKLPIMGNFQ